MAQHAPLFSMATFLSRLSGSAAKYEPLPRFGHVSQSVGSKVVVQGGLTKDFSEKTQQQLTSVVETLDPYSELWEQRQVEGDVPSPGTCRAASTSINDDLYTFGGGDGRNFFNTLHKLDTKTWHWCQLPPQNAEGAPMPKAACGMISIKDSLVVFGGYGRPRGPAEPGSFMKSTRFTDGRGWTNELHIYHLKEGVRVVTVWSRQYFSQHEAVLHDVHTCMYMYMYMYVYTPVVRLSTMDNTHCYAQFCKATSTLSV